MFIPYNFVTCKGLIRQIDLDVPETELLKQCKSNITILDVKRLNRKNIIDGSVEFVPTGTVLMTFKEINQRRTQHNNNSIKRNFAQATTSNSPKRRVVFQMANQTPNNNALYYPNGRLSNVTASPAKSTNSFITSSVDNRDLVDPDCAE
ncbi:hypothetical protein ABEB36_009621 [Hypothenemus hampei]|uniref:Uncharacterized protein n=1 Tax=Hypothenemus hampei TaxID=57062 RepID=A0ABD1EHJ4_HYPHA